jgi:tRNA-splicing ligase RtcB
MKDQRGVEILEGDRLRCDDGYDVIACRDEAGKLVGRLADAPACFGIPTMLYSLNDGVRHTVTVRQAQPVKPTHVFAEVVDPKAADQFTEAMRQTFVVAGALMPDVHAGYTLPIGAVVACQNYVVPAYVGYDIGCGMCAVPTTATRSGISIFGSVIADTIYRTIPTGFSHNARPSEWYEGGLLPRTPTTHEIFERNGLRQLGSLGGGNHFIEIGVDETECVWVIVHSGSRGIGHAVATHYMKLASGDDKAREGHFGFAADSAEGMDYILDMNFCLEFALENRRLLVQRTVNAIAQHCPGVTARWDHLINRNHNHAELKDGLWIHRKGATHAEAGMMGVIPGNMRDGSFIVRGKGNRDALWSSSHGAGRVMGRKEAQRTLQVGDFERSMEGIVAKVTAATLDESPAAYKDIFDVMRQQSSLVEVLHHVKPLVNIKAGEA